ncbi:MAG: sigma-70 family RNA polymerase sigma factor [Synechococcus sp. ELA057]
MSSGGLGWWLDTIGRYPLLSPAQEIELGTAIQAWLTHPDGDRCPPAIRRRGERAKRRFIECNLRLAVSYVSQRCHRLAKNHSQDDLIQAANLGLITAVERFDPVRGYRFSTYAYWWIRQAVTSWADRHGRAVSIPAIHSQHLGRLGAVRRRLLLELGREPLRHELAAALGVSERVLEQLLINGQPIGSLDRVIADEGGMELGDLIATADITLEEQDDNESRHQQARQLRQLIRRLPRREQRLVEQCYGLDGVERSRQEVARAAGISSRALNLILQSVEQQLRRMAVQLELLTVPEVLPAARLRRPRRRRTAWLWEQLSLWPATPAPSQATRSATYQEARAAPTDTPAPAHRPRPAG